MKTQPLEIAHLTVQLTEHPEVWSPLSAIEMLSCLMEHGHLAGLEQRRVLDFGTGSGIVGIVCGLLGAAPIELSDYSAIAAQVAEANARLNGLTQVRGIQSDRFQQIPPVAYDLIISNPPVQPWLFTELEHPDNRSKVAAWNEAGADGRLVLDALLTIAADFFATARSVDHFIVLSPWPSPNVAAARHPLAGMLATTLRRRARDSARLSRALHSAVATSPSIRWRSADLSN